MRDKKLQVDTKEQEILKMLISNIDFLRNKTFKSQFEEYQQLKQI